MEREATLKRRDPPLGSGPRPCLTTVYTYRMVLAARHARFRQVRSRCHPSWTPYLQQVKWQRRVGYEGIAWFAATVAGQLVPVALILATLALSVCRYHPSPVSGREAQQSVAESPEDSVTILR